jgi:hypothetical protein
MSPFFSIASVRFQMKLHLRPPDSRPTPRAGLLLQRIGAIEDQLHSPGIDIVPDCTNLCSPQPPSFRPSNVCRNTPILRVAVPSVKTEVQANFLHLYRPECVESRPYAVVLSLGVASTDCRRASFLAWTTADRSARLLGVNGNVCVVGYANSFRFDVTDV